MSDFNNTPPHFEEITEQSFGHLFFHYCFKPPIYKQLRNDSDGNNLKNIIGGTHLFEIEYDTWKGMGVAMSFDYQNSKMRYFRYGATPEMWNKKAGEFASQFRGDNS